MKKLMLMGRSGSGKTALASVLMGGQCGKEQNKTQCVQRNGWVIDTPGEYVESPWFGGAIALYAYEADIVGLILSATEPFSLYNPNITGMVNREVVGIVTKIDDPKANAPRAERWLQLAGCKKIFRVSAVTGEGIEDLMQYLEKSQRKSQKSPTK